MYAWEATCFQCFGHRHEVWIWRNIQVPDLVTEEKRYMKAQRKRNWLHYIYWNQFWMCDKENIETYYLCGVSVCTLLIQTPELTQRYKNMIFYKVIFNGCGLLLTLETIRTYYQLWSAKIITRRLILHWSANFPNKELDKYLEVLHISNFWICVKCKLFKMDPKFQVIQSLLRLVQVADT